MTVTIIKKVHEHVVVDPPHCDKISMTLPIGPFEQEGVIAAMKKLVSNYYGVTAHKRGYFHSVYVFTGNFSERTFLIQASPKNFGVSFFRTEFNPAKNPIEEVRAFIDGIVPGGFARLIKEGRCTRVDVAVDVHHVLPGQLLITHPGLHLDRAYGKGGSATGYELGSRQSAKHFTVYHKNAQLKHQNAKQMWKESVPDHSITRIEANITERFATKQLAALPNPFEKLVIADLGSLKEADDMTRLFLLASRSSGAHAALSCLSVPVRKAFHDRLEKAQAQWWNPVNDWGAWAAEAGKLVNPPPASFNLQLHAGIHTQPKAPLTVFQMTA